jgi:predicted house-cleaning noncanonical NTP pyrophosphatase (MazG superfamily)
MRKSYNKLIRDKIPEIIESSGKTYKLEIADTKLYREKLHEKLIEEASEFRDEPCTEEMADILEVLEALMSEYGISRDKVLEVKEKKATDRGAFEKRYILDYVD